MMYFLFYLKTNINKLLLSLNVLDKYAIKIIIKTYKVQKLTLIISNKKIVKYP